MVAFCVNFETSCVLIIVIFVVVISLVKKQIIVGVYVVLVGDFNSFFEFLASL